MLTDLAIKNLKPAERLYRVPDGGGLYVEVSPKGRKVFRLTYRYAGRNRTATLGSFPDLKLSKARLLRETYKEAVRSGEDPAPRQQHQEPRPAAPEAETWSALVERYLEKRRREGAAPATLKKLGLHAAVTIREFGDMRPSEIGAQKIIAACRHYEDQGMLNSAHAVRTLCSQVFRFAIAHGIAEQDPAAPTRDALARPRNVGHPGITDPKRIGELMRALRANPGGPVVRAGLLLSAYLFPRSGEIRRMEWGQVDGDLWTAPASIMKKNRDHLVPLPRQALELLDWLRPITGRERLVLHTNSANGLVSENSFNHALRRLGFGKDEHVHHGFRITASTVLHENGWNSDWIEAQLAHVEENKVKGAYNKALYLKDRKRMMQWYADWLDERERHQ